jgi:uncharacterized protein YecE (DUF72 family)
VRLVRPESELRIGTSGYVYASWKRRFYPDGLPARSWFPYYATHFDTVELNGTFYRLPEASVFARWRQQVPDGFIFAVKFSRFGTHMKRLLGARETIGRFVRRARRLGPRLGPVLVQLPPRWAPDLARLDRFLGAAPRDMRWVVEIRDERWLGDELYALLRRHDTALCIHDMIPDHPRAVTTDFTYVRFHGIHYGGSYSAAALTPWADWIAGRLAEHVAVFAYFNNDVDGHAIENARTLARLVVRRSGRRSARAQ